MSPFLDRATALRFARKKEFFLYLPHIFIEGVSLGKGQKRGRNRLEKEKICSTFDDLCRSFDDLYGIRESCECGESKEPGGREADSI